MRPLGAWPVVFQPTSNQNQLIKNGGRRRRGIRELGKSENYFSTFFSSLGHTNRGRERKKKLEKYSSIFRALLWQGRQKKEDENHCRG